MFNQDLLGSIIDGRYKITALIGQGGMGAVYKATEIGFDREVALKLMHIYHLSDPENRSRFEREGKVLSSLQHPNIITIYRFGVWNDQVPYLAMEYLSGKTLREVLDAESRLSPELTLDIAIHLCGALEYAHNNGVIHRDIKPSNIIIHNDLSAGSVKIVDFGLIKLLPESWQVSQKLTQTGFLIGTAQYLSPEQCLGKNVDRRSDIYSLAAMLYECVTGHAPFDAENPIGIIHKHAHEMPAAPENLGSGLDLVLLKALQKDPDLRYQSATDLLEALTQVRFEKVIYQEEKLLPWSNSVKKTNPSSLAAAVFCGAAALLIAAVFFGFGQQKQLSKATLVTVSAKQHVTLRLQEAEQAVLQAESCTNQPSACAAFSARALSKLSQISTNTDEETAARELKILRRIHSLLADESVIAHVPDLYDNLFNSLNQRYTKEHASKADIIILQILALFADHKGDLHGQLFARECLAKFYLSAKNYKACLNELEEEEKLIKKHHLETSRKNGVWLETKANYLLQTDSKKTKEIRRNLHRSYEILQSLHNEAPESLFMRTRDIGLRSVENGDFSFAEKVLIAAREMVLRGVADNTQLLNIDNTLTQIEMKLGRYDEAKKYCLEEIELRSAQANNENDPSLKKAEEILNKIEIVRSALKRKAGA